MLTMAIANIPAEGDLRVSKIIGVMSGFVCRRLRG